MYQKLVKLQKYKIMSFLYFSLLLGIYERNNRNIVTTNGGTRFYYISVSFYDIHTFHTNK